MSQSGSSSEIYLTCDEELDFWRKIVDAPGVFPEVILPMGKYVYLFLGWNKVVLRYDLLDDSLIPIRRNRSYYRIVKVHNKIYALDGGIVECYDPDCETWRRVRSVGRTVVDDAFAMCGRIYVLGQCDLINRRHTINLADLVDIDNPDDVRPLPMYMMWMRVYEPITDTWNTVKLPRMFPRKESAVVFENRLYLTWRGFNNLKLRCIEEYDPVLNVWTRLPDLPFMYSGEETLVVEGKLIVFDYYECKCPVSPAVCWDNITRAW